MNSHVPSDPSVDSLVPTVTRTPSWHLLFGTIPATTRRQLAPADAPLSNSAGCTFAAISFCSEPGGRGTVPPPAALAIIRCGGTIFIGVASRLVVLTHLHIICQGESLSPHSSQVVQSHPTRCIEHISQMSFMRASAASSVITSGTGVSRASSPESSSQLPHTKRSANSERSSVSSLKSTGEVMCGVAWRCSWLAIPDGHMRLGERIVHGPCHDSRAGLTPI